ncbi:MAG TPA: phage holin family protein [Candidatus Megamonas gallistercoris]|nr:phage holin family protein [Candidatus Megamonas gallistercoris]
MNFFRIKEIDKWKFYNNSIRKLYILMLIILAHELDIIIGEDMNIRNVTICFFIGSEGLNILENAVTMNISLPNILKKILERIQNKNK